jgi:Ras-related C3 botulinum toxin substrate 1
MERKRSISWIVSIQCYYNIDIYCYCRWDTAGCSVDNDVLRPLSYPNADIIMICAAVISSETFVNIKRKWIPEAKQYCPDVPIMVIGMKTDLRDNIETAKDLSNRGFKLVTTETGENIAKEVGAVIYMETSAILLKTKHVFEEAVTIVMERSDNYLKKRKKNTNKNKKCKVM